MTTKSSCYGNRAKLQILKPTRVLAHLAADGAQKHLFRGIHTTLRFLVWRRNRKLLYSVADLPQLGGESTTD